MVGFAALFAISQLPAVASFVASHLVMIPRRALGPEPWQIATAPLFHFRFLSLISSLLGLWFFGTPIEEQLSRARFVRILIGALLCSSITAAVVGRLLAPDLLVAGAAPAMSAFIAAFGAVYRGTPLLLFGAAQMRASTCAWLFLGVTAFSYLMSLDFVGLAAATAAAAFGYRASRPKSRQPRRLVFGAIRTRWDRFRLWRLRRRYKVIPGGRDSKRYLN
jgi:membrane associated rhomboid family serine protease